jgi:hypothetical protein
MVFMLSLSLFLWPYPSWLACYAMKVCFFSLGFFFGITPIRAKEPSEARNLARLLLKEKPLFEEFSNFLRAIVSHVT